MRAAMAAIVLVGCAAAPAPPSPRVVPTAGPRPEPTRAEGTVAKAPPTIEIALGGFAACLRLRGALHCWKRDAPVTPPLSKSVPPMPGLNGVTHVGFGYGHACALTAGGRVWCWGENEYGQLGVGSAEERRAAPERVPGIEGATDLAVGLFHTCALLGDRSVTCWGWNRNGQTGSDTEYAPAARELVLPEPVPGLSGALEIEAGRNHTCARTVRGWECFGSAQFESQRQRAGGQSPEPAPVDELSDFATLSLHDETACGVTSSGVGCYGSGAFSLLVSRPMRTDRPIPVAVAGATSVTVGAYHACAITHRGRVVCWGLDTDGRLGRGRVIEGYEPNAPEEVTGLTGVRSLALDATGTCALTARDELYCWGSLPHLPAAPRAASATPVRIAVE
ncbi:MAG: hypothetical protein IT377_00495 [Polyangiaceae bacterium]|nr:hypothetical protein [Polyangiaceae bacterium]